MPGLIGPRAAAEKLRRRRVVRLVSLAVALVALVLLVPLAVANIADDVGQVAGPDQHFASLAVPGPPMRADRRARAHASVSSLPQATLSLVPSAGTVPVPSSFLGISTEYWGIPLFERDTPVFERVLSLLHVAGDGPLILRIGGDSADHSFYYRRPRRMPAWAYELTPDYLARLKALVKRDRVKLIVDLNLVTDTPLIAATWARAAETSLPHGSIVGFEIGNEPDLYTRRFWVATIARSPFESRPLPLELTPPTYVQDFAEYARVLGENSPDIPLVGPAVAHVRLGLPFISELIQAQRPELGMVTAHLYPYSACVRNRRSDGYPTVPRILSRQAASDFGSYIAPAVEMAHAAGLKFRLTEFNSVTCGGKPGVSNTFATALWAPDALFNAMRAGADGANLHVQAADVNQAFTVTRGGLLPRPLMYGLMLFTRTLGPEARLARVHLTAPRSLDLSAWAVQVKHRILHLLLIDKGSRSVRVDLRIPSGAPATVQRLLAPSPYSTSGVTLNGQQLSYAGRWTGTPRTQTIAPLARGGYVLTLPRRSAALLTVSLGAPRSHPRQTAVHPRHTAVSEHHRRVAVTKHPVLAVGLDRPRKH